MFLEWVVEYSLLGKPEMGENLEKYTIFSLGSRNIIVVLGERNPKMPKTCQVRGQVFEIFRKKDFRIRRFYRARPLAIVVCTQERCKDAQEIMGLGDMRLGRKI
uniref:Uncharacterized protein n=1 Tax=Cacopsylla melanoneura TaxID=428564 RepID=A0A8D9BWZ0_9HEMI